MTRTNYIFIDFENVQEADLARIAGKPVQVVLVLGEQHRKLPVALVRQLHQYASAVRWWKPVAVARTPWTWSWPVAWARRKTLTLTDTFTFSPKTKISTLWLHTTKPTTSLPLGISRSARFRC